MPTIMRWLNERTMARVKRGLSDRRHNPIVCPTLARPECRNSSAQRAGPRLRPRTQSAAGVTLIELLVATTLLSMLSVGLLMALRFANLSVAQHVRTYVPYMLALFAGLLLIICIPEISLTLPRLAGLIR